MRLENNGATTTGTQRFHATIRKQGLNPHVDVPERVSRALTVYSRAGRISFEGYLNQTPIRGTLVPVGRGRHWLYISGGMRSVASVGPGDTVSLELHGVHPDEVRSPSDVVAELRLVAGAQAAFRALSPSHRRELLRYIDDARTPETRRRRIQKTVGHLLGKEEVAQRGAAHVRKRPLWTCPRCGNQFVNRNQYHSCRRYDLSEPFAGKPAHVRNLFDRFRAMVEECGPVKAVTYRD